MLARGTPVRAVSASRRSDDPAPDGALSIGLKIGRRSLDLVLMDFVGQVRATRRRSYAWPLPDAVLDFACSEIAALLADLTPLQRARVAGLGIASPFELWNWADEVGAPQGEMEAWRGVDLIAALEGDLPFPVFLQNDATSACVAEVVFGRGSAFKDFFYFFIGFFIGGGVVLNGGVFTGSGGNAGAIGSMPVPARGQEADPADRRRVDPSAETRLKTAKIDPSPLWLQPENWDGFGKHLDAWIAEIAPSLAYAIAATSSVIDFPPSSSTAPSRHPSGAGSSPAPPDPWPHSISPASSRRRSSRARSGRTRARSAGPACRC